MNDRPDSPAELKARALRHLARREHSRHELKRKLAPHAESGEALEAVLDALTAKRQLSDERYAEARARQLARKYGAARIRHDLSAKGLPKELVENVSAAAKESELQRALSILKRKYRSNAATHEERARRARFLQGRGFTSEIVNQAIGGNDA